MPYRVSDGVSLHAVAVVVRFSTNRQAAEAVAHDARRRRPHQRLPRAVGSTFDMRVREGRRISSYEGRINAYDPPRHLGVSFWGGLFRPGIVMHVDYRIADCRPAAGWSTTPRSSSIDLHGPVKLAIPIARVFTFFQTPLLHAQSEAPGGSGRPKRETRRNARYTAQSSRLAADPQRDSRRRSLTLPENGQLESGLLPGKACTVDTPFGSEREMAQEQGGQIDTVMQEIAGLPPAAGVCRRRPRSGRWTPTRSCGRKRPATSRSSGPSWPRSCTGSSPYDKVLEWNEPVAKWFVGGQDERLVQLPRRASGHVAQEQGRPSSGKASRATRARSPTSNCTAKCASSPTCSKTLGIGQGDVVSIYMPMVPELAIAMLACARIGAVHSVIFAGFSAEAIADRNNDAGAKLQITADAGWRRGKELPLKNTVDEALAKSPTVEKCVVLDARPATRSHMQEGRDLWWHDLMDEGLGRLPRRAARQRDAAVHPLHQRLDRQAQGHQAHHGRLQPVREEDVRVGVRPSRRRRLLVHGRLRLGHRPQLRRLRPAVGRGDGADVRRRAELPDEGRFWELDREVQRDDLLHRPDGDPRVHQVGRRPGRRSTTCRACGCWAPWAKASIPKPGCGTTTRSAASAARSSTPGGRPRRAAS